MILCSLKPIGGKAMMARTAIPLLVMFALTIFALGCSTGNDPVAPQDNSAAMTQEDVTENRIIWSTFRVGFNPADGTAIIVPTREPDIHVNVTSFVKPPQCPDCVIIAGNSYFPGLQEWHLTVQLKNPSIKAGYDVRGLVYNLGKKYIKNPDGFMNLYLGQDMQFKAFAKADPVRAFWPGAVNSETYIFHFPTGGNWAFVDYIIDASWPGNCPEPIMENVSFPERMENGIDVSDLTVQAFDHQGEFFVVFADLTPIGGEPTAMFDDGVHGDGDPEDGVYGIADVVASAQPGVYTINMWAFDVNMNYGWNSFRVEVFGEFINPPVIDEIIMSRTTCYKSSSTEKITLECVAHDPDFDELQYTWTSTGGSFDDDEGPVAVWKAPAGVGKYYVNCEVTDGKGGYDDMDSGKIRVTKYAVLNPAEAYDFHVEDLFSSGSYFNLSDYTPGNVVMLNFWLTT